MSPRQCFGKNMDKIHEPVLLQEVLEILDLKEGDFVVDGTYGFGGHSAEILKRIGKGGKLIAIEKDPEVFAKNLENLQDKRVIKFNDDFASIAEIVEESGLKKVDKILLDLGVSSYHFDSGSRGFSFDSDERIDMRLDNSHGISAYEVVNTLTQDEIADIIYELGGERYSRRIARAIVERRKQTKITSARELAKIVEKSIPYKGKIHPATKTFQGIRIYVNDELNKIKQFLMNSESILNKNAIVVIISFHSGEDKIVKNYFRDNKDKLTILTKKPIAASEEELARNPRARSAKLRAAEYNPQ